MKNYTKTGQIILNAVFILISAAYLLPLLLLISISLSSEASIKEFGYTLIPKVVDFTAYRMVFKKPDTIINAYVVTIAFTAITTILSLIVMAMAAYPLSRKNCKFKNVLSFYLFFTMLFSGGLVPSYIINSKYLHLDNNFWIYVLPALVSAWNVIIIRTFFQGLPSELVEAAKIDGASEIKIFYKMIIPLSTPVLATIAFMTLLAKWNDWNTTLIYIRNPKLYSLQYMLQRILREAQYIKQVANEGSGLFNSDDAPIESYRYAMAILAAGPMLVIFPIFQKYLTQGLVVGSVKG